MQIHNRTPLECDGALADLVLQAARQAVPDRFEALISLGHAGPRNRPLLPLLIGLIDAAAVVAQAAADNAWDESEPIDRQLLADLTSQCRAIAATLENTINIR